MRVAARRYVLAWVKPRNVKADIDKAGAFPPLKKINRTIKKLSLAACAPFDYVRADKQ